MSYAIKVVWLDGEEEYLHEGLGDTPANFMTRKSAEDQKEFMNIGMVDEVQSINVVPYLSKVRQFSIGGNK